MTIRWLLILTVLGISSIAPYATGSETIPNGDTSGIADPAVSDQQRIKVTFINPGMPDPEHVAGSFWISVSDFMQAAARQLNIDLEVIYSERNHIKMSRQALEVASREKRPDYLIIVNQKLVADNMLKVADKAGIKVFIILSTFLESQSREMGKPREKYKNWIGSLVPDYRMAGYSSGKRLIGEVIRSDISPDGNIRLFGLAGDRVTQSSVDRVDGFRKAASEHPNINLQQVFVGDGRKDQVREQTKLALKRYPRTNAIWAGSDSMALGAIEGAIESNRAPGKNILIGGLNWENDALEKVRDGKLVTSVGGDFMIGGWALVLLHDYHHGKDFDGEGAELQIKGFTLLDGRNIDDFLKKFGDRDWNKINFPKFSKVLNPKEGKYDFSIERLLGW